MKISINISEVLLKAWKITWKFKILWIFGILASCGTNNRGNFNNSYSNSGNNGGNFGDGNLPEPFRRLATMNWQDAIQSFLGEHWGIIAAAILLICVLSLLFYALGIIGRTGLIKGATLADGGAESLSFGELWSASMHYFWRMFLLGVLVGLPFFIIAVVLLVIFFAAVIGLIANREAGSMIAGLFAALGVFVPVICCLGIIRFIVEMIVDQSKNAIVIEDVGVIESLRRGWEVFKNNFLTIILLAIILGVLGGIVSFIIAIPLILAIAPTVASVALLAANSDTTMSLVPLAFAGICFLIYLPVLLVLRGVEGTYIQSVWTLTYLRITAPAPEPPPDPPVLPETPDAS